MHAFETMSAPPLQHIRSKLTVTRHLIVVGRCKMPGRATNIAPLWDSAAASDIAQQRPMIMKQYSAMNRDTMSKHRRSEALPNCTPYMQAIKRHVYISTGRRRITATDTASYSNKASTLLAEQLGGCHHRHVMCLSLS